MEAGMIVIVEDRKRPAGGSTAPQSEMATNSTAPVSLDDLAGDSNACGRIGTVIAQAMRRARPRD
jgi:hypothetical protein